MRRTTAVLVLALIMAAIFGPTAGVCVFMVSAVAGMASVQAALVCGGLTAGLVFAGYVHYGIRQ